MLFARSLTGQHEVGNDGLVGGVLVKDDADAVAGEHVRRAAVLLQDQLLRDGGLGIDEHRAHRALLGNAAVVDDRHAVADGVDDLHLVRDDNDRDAKLAVDLRQKLQDLAGRGGVERRGRLVTEQIPRACRKRPRDGNALLLTAGELRGVCARAPVKADELQKLHRALFCRRLRRPGKLQREQDVSEDRALLQQIEVLKDHADAAARPQQLLLGKRGQLLSVQHDLTGGRRLQEVDAAHQRGLARTGQADDAEDLTVADGEGNVLQRGDGGGRSGVVDLAQML